MWYYFDKDIDWIDNTYENFNKELDIIRNDLGLDVHDGYDRNCEDDSLGYSHIVFKVDSSNVSPGDLYIIALKYKSLGSF